jgi:acyl dehydratase
MTGVPNAHATSTAIAISEYLRQVGGVLGTSHWVTVNQDMIDRFADLTADRQFIHVDPIRAGETAFGGTVAHGFLTLSLLSLMSFSAVPAINGVQMGINYGFNVVRFITPVRAGDRVRGHFTLNQCIEREPGQWQSTLAVRVEIENVPKPALVAEWISLAIIR